MDVAIRLVQHRQISTVLYLYVFFQGKGLRSLHCVPFAHRLYQQPLAAFSFQLSLVILAAVAALFIRLSPVRSAPFGRVIRAAYAASDERLRRRGGGYHHPPLLFCGRGVNHFFNFPTLPYQQILSYGTRTIVSLYGQGRESGTI